MTNTYAAIVTDSLGDRLIYEPRTTWSEAHGVIWEELATRLESALADIKSAVTTPGDLERIGDLCAALHAWMMEMSPDRECCVYADRLEFAIVHHQRFRKADDTI